MKSKTEYMAADILDILMLGIIQETLNQSK